MAVSFGCTFDTGTYGVAQGVEKRRSTTTDTYSDENGEVVGYQTRDEIEEISLDFVYDGALAAPTEGGTMTIDSNDYIVEEVTETEANDAFRKVAITGRRFIPNAVP